MTRIVIYLLLLGMLVAYRPLPPYPTPPASTLPPPGTRAQAPSVPTALSPCAFQAQYSLPWRDNTVLLVGAYVCDTTNHQDEYHTANW